MKTLSAALATIFALLTTQDWPRKWQRIKVQEQS